MSLADDANLLLIPTGYKAQKLYSIFPTSGVGDFDFARTTSATRVAKNGFITTVGTNVPRLNYDILDGEVVGCPHLLLEPSRTNSVTYSENLSQLASQSNITITDNQTISPYGTLNAASFIDNSTSGVHRAFTNYSSSIASGQLVSHSIFAKAKEHKWFQLSTGGSTNDQWANFDLENGVIGNSSSSANPIIENYGNGWYRCILFATTSANNATLAGLVTLTNNLDATLRSPSYSGSNGGVYVFGLQIEQGSFLTSYIKSNSGSATTRAAETCNGSGDAATFNDSEGVLMAEISALTDEGSYRLISLSDGTLNQRITILYDIADNKIHGQCVNSTTQAFIPFVPPSISNTNKILFKYKANNFELWVNGFKVGTDTSGVVPSGLNKLSFDRGDGLNPFYGNTKQLQYFETALADTQLEQLTSWTSFTDMAEGQLYTIE